MVTHRPFPGRASVRGALAALAAAGLLAGPAAAPAQADPVPPGPVAPAPVTPASPVTPTAGAAPTTPAAGAAGHQVRYTLTAGDAADFDLYYMGTQPADMAAYNADPYTYLKKATVSVGPDAPWSFETSLADPSWAILTVSSTTHGLRAAPNAHCEVAVDGQVAVQQDAPYNLSCKLGKW